MSNCGHPINDQNDTMLLMSMMNMVSEECVFFTWVCVHLCTGHPINDQDDSMLLMSMMNIVSAECVLFKRVCMYN